MSNNKTKCKELQNFALPNSKFFHAACFGLWAARSSAAEGFVFEREGLQGIKATMDAADYCKKFETFSKFEAGSVFTALLWMVSVCYEGNARFTAEKIIIKKSEFLKAIGRTRTGVANAMWAAARFLYCFKFEGRGALFETFEQCRGGWAVTLNKALIKDFFQSKIELPCDFFSALNARQIRVAFVLLRQIRLGQKTLKIADLMRDALRGLANRLWNKARDRLLKDLKKVAQICGFELEAPAESGKSFFKEGILKLIFCGGAMAEKVMRRIPWQKVFGGFFDDLKMAWLWFDQSGAEFSTAQLLAMQGVDFTPYKPPEQKWRRKRKKRGKK